MREFHTRGAIRRRGREEGGRWEESKRNRRGLETRSRRDEWVGKAAEWAE